MGTEDGLLQAEEGRPHRSLAVQGTEVDRQLEAG